jgi:glutamyl-tRNA synthetase (EC 6.1.1.17)/glutamate--tRNA(Gln) ligase (EC 6.1.1.24)
MKLRFAPSPTGHLHVGNARTLILNWLYAKKHGADFILRFDDTDPERSRDEYAEQIKVDMAWLGLVYSQAYKQSDRLSLYLEAAEQLKQNGRLYPCYETKQELDFKRKRQLSQGRPPIYDRAALKLTAEDIAQFEAEGRVPHWRFKLNAGEIAWDDLAHGALAFQGANLSDPILIRENGAPVFTLSGVVDDIDLKITHIVRGDDHISNTAIQIQIIEALGCDPRAFHFAHLPLMTGAQGEGFSKRLGSLSLKQLHADGYEPLALLNYLGRLGNSKEYELAFSLEELAQTFDLQEYGRSSPKFSLEDLGRVNAKILQALSFDSIKERLEQEGYPDVTLEFWEMVKGNLNKLQDLRLYTQICFAEVTPVTTDAAYLQLACEALPPEPWSEATWKQWTTVLKESTGRKGKDLFMPLRQALTGEDHGPEMHKLLPFIGYEKAIKRLSGRRA